MQTQITTRPTLRAQPLVNDMRYRLFFLHRAYHFFELTSLSTRFSSIDSANIFFNSAFSFSNSLSRLASAISMSPYLRFHRWKVAFDMFDSRQMDSTVYLQEMPSNSSMSRAKNALWHPCIFPLFGRERNMHGMHMCRAAVTQSTFGSSLACPRQSR